MARDLDGIGECRVEWASAGRPPEKFVFEYAVTPAREAALWWDALGEVPTPEAMGELLAAGVVDGGDASAWAGALGHRPRPDEVRELVAAGWDRGHDAMAWARAFGRLPERSEVRPAPGRRDRRVAGRPVGGCDRAPAWG